VVVGGLAALYGATGVAQASQNLMQVVWSVPRNSRPNPIVARLRSLLLVVVAGVVFVAIAALEVVVDQVFAGAVPWALRLVVEAATVLAIAGVFTLLFRLATAHHHSLREAAPGALAVGLMWLALQAAGSAYVERVVIGANDMNKTFALVLGLVALIYVASVMAVFGAEINVVRARRLYPRSLLTPFTDDVDLTEGDRRAYTAYAKGQRHKGFEVVDVRFDRPEGEDTPAEPEPHAAEPP
jgi:uncharacterized BrkB/YihY/UPF0761 family membrane protein